MSEHSMWPLSPSSILLHRIGNHTIHDWCHHWHDPALTVNAQTWITKEDQQLLIEHNDATLVDIHGNILGSIGSGVTPITSTKSFAIEYPWHLLAIGEEVIAALAESDIQGEVHPNAVIEGTLHLGKGSRILPGVYIEGNVTIGENCKIGPNCYIRGNSSIGDTVHIGQSVEIKNSIIGSNSAIGHLSYVGDSIIGDGVNFGAGTTVSNFRHDAANHRTMVDGELVDTGRRKFGTIVGDGVHTGIHTSIYPGRKLAARSSTRPGDIVQSDIEN